MATTIKSVSDLFASWEALLANASPTEADCKRMSVLEGKIEAHSRLWLGRDANENEAGRVVARSRLR